MITKEQCVKGVKIVINSKNLKSNNEMFWSDTPQKGNGLYVYNRQNIHGIYELPVDTVLELTSNLKYSEVYFKTEDGKKYSAFWGYFKSKVDLVEGVEQPETPDMSQKKRYKIFRNGKAFKPKYFNDLGKVKSSLLIAFGYYEKQYEMFKEYGERNPELEDNEVPYWFTGDYGFNREDCKEFQIMEYTGTDRKQKPVDIKFDVEKYYDQSMKLIDITIKFGHASRELYKKTMGSGDYSYLLVYIPDEYRDPKNFTKTTYGYTYNNIDFSTLKESKRIKDIMKKSGVKGTRKSTKFGKTAIVFKNIDDLKQVMLRLDPKEYFILDCDGDQLVEKNTRFVKLVMLQQKSEEL